MQDKKLEIFIIAASVFFLAHTVDHAARDLHWALTAEAIPFLAAYGRDTGRCLRGALSLSPRQAGCAFLGHFWDSRRCGRLARPFQPVHGPTAGIHLPRLPIIAGGLARRRHSGWADAGPDRHHASCRYAVGEKSPEINNGELPKNRGNSGSPLPLGGHLT